MEKLLYEHEKQRIKSVVFGADKTNMVIDYVGGDAHYRVYSKIVEFHNAPINKNFGIISPDTTVSQTDYSGLGEYNEWILK